MRVDRLWKPRDGYQTIRDEAVSSRYFRYDGLDEAYLPYHRLYQDLDEEQLRELLSDAKKNRWQALDLQSCGLTSLPEGVWDLPDLKVLYLGNMNQRGHSNTFSRLPDSMKLLSNLLVLQLSESHITALPEFDGSFSALRCLYLPSCPIRVLPDSIGGLANLQRLDLSGTQISVLPDSI